MFRRTIEHFISPVVIAVKNDKTVKIALDSKKLNDAIHKNKYQMPGIDHLIDSREKKSHGSGSSLLQMEKPQKNKNVMQS